MAEIFITFFFKKNKYLKKKFKVDAVNRKKWRLLEEREREKRGNCLIIYTTENIIYIYIYILKKDGRDGRGSPAAGRGKRPLMAMKKEGPDAPS